MKKEEEKGKEGRRKIEKYVMTFLKTEYLSREPCQMQWTIKTSVRCAVGWAVPPLALPPPKCKTFTPSTFGGDCIETLIKRAFRFFCCCCCSMRPLRCDPMQSGWHSYIKREGTPRSTWGSATEGEPSKESAGELPMQAQEKSVIGPSSWISSLQKYKKAKFCC